MPPTRGCHPSAEISAPVPPGRPPVPPRLRVEGLEDRATPASSLPALTPTATDNDYTRIQNALDAAVNGDTIHAPRHLRLDRGQRGGELGQGQRRHHRHRRRLQLLVRDGLNSVTLTADALGDATIQGPGDVASVNLEGFLVFSGGDNQNWTISNLRHPRLRPRHRHVQRPGGADAFDGTTITNNHIRIAADLNAVAAPADVSQNIGIHYSFGKNQTISDNVIEIPGTGVSDPWPT